MTLLRKCNNNWFEFVASLEEQLHKDISSISSTAYEYITTRGYTEVNMDQSYAAYCVVQEDGYEQDRIVNGEIVSKQIQMTQKSISEALSEAAKALIVKQRKAIQRRCKRKQESQVYIPLVVR